MLAACDLSRDAMPALFEGSDVASCDLGVAQAWNMPPALVVGGRGGSAGWSGSAWPMPVRRCCRWVPQASPPSVKEFLSKPESAVHSACHALPGRWRLMSVMLSAASLSGLGGKINRSRQRCRRSRGGADGGWLYRSVWFLPICLANARRTTTRRLRASFWPDASAWAGRAGAGGAGRGGLCAGGWYGRGAHLRHQAAEHHAYRRRGAQRLLAANAGGYPAACNSIAYRRRCRPGAGGGGAGAAGGSNEARPPGLLKPAAAEQAHRPDDRRVAHMRRSETASARFYQQLKPLMS